MNTILSRLESLPEEKKEKLLKVLKESGEEYGVYPLSAEQKRMWFLYQVDKKNPYYNIVFGIGISGSLDVKRLEQAIRFVISQQKMLKTYVIMLEGEAFQTEDTETDFTLETVNISSKEEETGLFDEAYRQSFDLEHELPYVIKLLRYSENQYTLMFKIHHMFCDGWSMGVLKNQIFDAYHALAEGREPAAANTYQYYDYAMQNHEAKQDDVIFWKETLKSANFSTELPYSHPESRDISSSFISEKQVGDYHAVKEYCAKLKISAYTFFLGIYGMMLYSYSGERDFVVGSPVLNRNDAKWSSVVGFFANTVPVSFGFSECESLESYFGRLNEIVIDSLDHSEMQFDQIVELMNIRRHDNENPMFQSVFAYANEMLTGNGNRDESGLKTEMLRSQHDRTPQFNLICYLTEKNESYVLSFAGKGTVFSKQRVEEMQDRFLKITEKVVSGKAVGTDHISVTESQEHEDEVLEKIRMHVAEKLKGSFEIREIFCDSYGNFILAYYVSEKKIENLDVTQLFSDENYTVIPVQVCALPETDEGEVDTVGLHSHTVRLIREIRRKYYFYHNNSKVTDLCLEQSLKNEIEYYSFNQLVSKANADEKKESEQNAESDSEKLSVLYAGEIEPYPFENLGDVIRMMDEQLLNNEFIYIDRDGSRNLHTYREMFRTAQRIAVNMRQSGMKKQDKAVILINDIYEFCCIFWACMLSGIIAVPMTAPDLTDYVPENGAVGRILKIVEICESPYVISRPEDIAALTAIQPDLNTIPDTYLLSETDESFEAPEVSSEDIAIIMFTSGSTGIPKGVQLCHRNLISRSVSYNRFAEITENDIMLNWMPMEHVGGLVMSMLHCTFKGCRQIEIDTQHILKNPVKWMEYLDEYRATLTWAPNFAYGLMLEQREAIEKIPLDLTSVRIILNGGEAINFNACHEFLVMMEQKGLSYSSMWPLWGMTETSSGVLVSKKFGQILYKNSVSVGEIIQGVKIRIVDDENRPVPVGEIGDLHVCGETVNMGYYKLDDENARSFTEDGWFVTGDRAMIQENEVIITGRNKEIMIINGVNVSCIEVEKNIEELEEIQTGTVGCIADKNADTSQDEVCIFYGEYDPEQRETIRSKISQLMNRSYGFSYDYLVPLDPDTIPRSSIGKIDKKVLLRKLRNGELRNVIANVKNQIPKWFAELKRNISVIRHTSESGRDVVLYVPDELVPEELKGSVRTVNEIKADPDNGTVVYCLPAFEGDMPKESALQMDILRRLAVGNKGTLLVLCEENNPLKSIAEGFSAALITEHTDRRIRIVSYDSAEVMKNVLVSEIADLNEAEEKFASCEYSSGKRYRTDFSSKDILKQKITRESFRFGGQYILIGGTGGIGTEFALHLLKNYKCRLHVIGRRSLSEVQDKIKLMKKYGTVDYYTADASDSNALTRLLERISSENGQPDGIVSLIGEENEKLHFEKFNEYIADSLNEEKILKIASARIGVLKSIDDYISDKENIDIILFSSSAGILGGQTYSVYSAVSKYLYDYEPSGNNPCFCFAWSKWQGLGMNSGETADDIIISNQAGYFSIQPESGFASMEGLIQRDIRRAVIGVNLNNGNIRRFRSVRMEDEFEHIALDIRYQAKENVRADFDRSVRAYRFETNVTEEKAVSEDMESGMLDLWKRVLNHQEITVNDDFFDVGGNSLKIIKLVESIRKEFNLSVSVSDLFGHPSIRSLCNFLSDTNETEEIETIEI